jgi:hypothetical protein
MTSSWMLRRSDLVRSDVLEELSASIIRVTRIDELGTTLAVTSNRCTLPRRIKIDDTLSDYHLIKAGVPQGSVIGPLLYFIYTANGPTRDHTPITTFADDTAILSSDTDPGRGSERLQHLSLLQNWLKMQNQGKPGQSF